MFRNVRSAAYALLRSDLDLAGAARRRGVRAADDDTAPRFPVPDVTTFGAAYKVRVRTDDRGAVLVAYTRDASTGAVTRSSIRLDPSAVAYVRRRLGAQ